MPSGPCALFMSKLLSINLILQTEKSTSKLQSLRKLILMS